MNAARIVYIIIFVMLLIPIWFYGLRKYKEMTGKKRPAYMVMIVAASLLSGVLCLYLHNITIQKQPLLVAERTVRVLYTEGASGKDAEALLREVGIAADNLEMAGVIDWNQFQGAVVDMPRKQREGLFGEGYPVRLTAENGAIAVVSVSIQSRDNRAWVTGVELISPGGAEEVLGDTTFFQAGTLD